MAFRFLSKKQDNDYGLLFNKLHDLIDIRYGEVVSLTFSDKQILNRSATNVEPFEPFPRESVVGVTEIFTDYENGKLVRDVQETTVVRAVVSAFHECRHAEVLEQMQYDTSEDMRYMSMTHLALMGNDYYNTHNWGNLITEIDAEYAGIQRGLSFLSEIYNPEEAERMILQYVNRMSSEVDYTIPDKSYSGGYTSLEEVHDAFLCSFEESKHCARKYWDVKIPKDKKEKEDAYNFIWNEMSDSVISKWNETADAYEQDKMIAAIVLHKHPRYTGYHAALEGIDFSMNTVFGPNWQKQAKVDIVLQQQQQSQKLSLLAISQLVFQDMISIKQTVVCDR